MIRRSLGEFDAQRTGIGANDATLPAGVASHSDPVAPGGLTTHRNGHCQTEVVAGADGCGWGPRPSSTDGVGP